MNNQEAREILANLEAAYRDLDSLMLTNDSIQLVNERIEALGMAISALQVQGLQPTCNNLATDTISRRAALDAVNSETVSTNPEHFKSSEKFIKFMDDADIASFGKWQWANGFNTAVVAAKIQLEKLPSAQLDHIANDSKMVEPCEDAISIDWITEYMNNMIGGSDRWWGVKWMLEDWTKWKESKKR